MVTEEMRPAIGFLVSLRPTGLGEAIKVLVRELADRAMRAVEAAGGAPTLVDIAAAGRPDPEELARRFAGLIILGGADVDPALYGERPHPATSGMDTDEDRYEIAATRSALEHETPLVGICRGMQVMNVACGGTLVQDLGAETGHHGPLDAVMVDQQVQVTPGSR